MPEVEAGVQCEGDDSLVAMGKMDGRAPTRSFFVAGQAYSSIVK
jgi:hypothetical protein